MWWPAFRVFVVALVTCLVLGVAAALARQQPSWIYGYGTASCGKWTANKNTALGYHEEAWVLGYVSGAGAAYPSDLAATDSAAIVAWVDQHCIQHPLDTISTASSRLVLELAKRHKAANGR